MSASTMPSGRFATRIGPGGSGDPMRADRRPAPGLPDGRKGGQRAIGVQQANEPGPTNPLLSAGSSSQQPQWANALLQTPTAPPSAAPTQQVAVVAPPPIQTMTPQERHMAVGKALGADKLPDSELAARLERSLFVQHALRSLLQKGTQPDHGDVAQVLADGVKSGAVSAADLPVIMASIPRDPAQLRPAIEALNQAATHAAVHIIGEQQRRKSKP